MTPLLTALSSFFDASARLSVALSLSPVVMASRAARTADLTSLLTALLRSWAFLLVPMRLICDLMFAIAVLRSFVRRNRSDAVRGRGARPGESRGGNHTQNQRLTLPG